MLTEQRIKEYDEEYKGYSREMLRKEADDIKEKFNAIVERGEYTPESLRYAEEIATRVDLFSSTHLKAGDALW